MFAGLLFKSPVLRYQAQFFIFVRAQLSRGTTCFNSVVVKLPFILSSMRSCEKWVKLRTTKTRNMVPSQMKFPTLRSKMKGESSTVLSPLQIS